MKTVKNFYTINRGFTTLMSVSLLTGLVFLFSNNLDFIVEAMNQGKYNFSNAAYSVLRIILGIIIPCVYIVPSRNEMGRMRTARLLFVIYGALYIVTLSWLFPYFASGAGDMVSFQSDIENSYLASYILWDTYSLAGSIYSLIFGILCIYVGIALDDQKNKVCSLVVLLPVLRLILPIITNIFSGNGVISALWITNNYIDIVILTCISCAFYLASTHDVTWINLIWNQEMENNTDDEIEL